MSKSIGVGGVWKNVAAQAVGVAGAWKTVTGEWVGVGGVWKQTFTSGGLASNVVTVSSFAASPATSSASVQLNTDGTSTYTGTLTSGSANWFTPTTGGIGSSYWVQLVVNSGTAPNGGSGTSLLALSSARSWLWSRATNGVTTANCTLNFYSDAGGVTLVHSDTFTVSVERDV